MFFLLLRMLLINSSILGKNNYQFPTFGDIISWVCTGVEKVVEVDWPVFVSCINFQAMKMNTKTTNYQCYFLVHLVNCLKMIDCSHDKNLYLVEMVVFKMVVVLFVQ